jgi:hypothetical protein
VYHSFENIMLAAALSVDAVKVGTETSDPIGELELAAPPALHVEHPIQPHLRTNAIKSSIFGLLHRPIDVSEGLVGQSSGDPLPTVVTNREALRQMERNRRARVANEGRYSI